MNKLFIIGNGFDIAHCIESKYSDLKNWYENKYNNYLCVDIDKYPLEVEDLVSPDILKKGLSDNLVSAILSYQLINKACEQANDWGTLETDLANIDFTEWFRKGECKKKEISAKTNRSEENVMIEIFNSLQYIEEFKEDTFKEWVDSLEIPDKKNDKLSDLFDEQTYFLNFNYTKTLEELYKDEIDIKKINYIHLNNSDPVNKYIIGTKFRNEDSDSIKYNSCIHKWFKDSFEKDTEYLIEKNKEFFMNLKRCKEIYVYGLSFSDVDLPYINEILNNIDSKSITIYITQHEQKNINHIKKAFGKVNKQNKILNFEEYPNNI